MYIHISKQVPMGFSILYVCFAHILEISVTPFSGTKCWFIQLMVTLQFIRLRWRLFYLAILSPTQWLFLWTQRALQQQILGKFKANKNFLAHQFPRQDFYFKSKEILFQFIKLSPCLPLLELVGYTMTMYNLKGSLMVLYDFYQNAL